MRIRHKYLLTCSSLALLVTASWYLFLYPQELWIRFNLVVRSDEINALADYFEGQSDFEEFICIADNVFLDKKAAPEQIHRDLQKHCRASRIVRGRLTGSGSIYYLGWDSKWLNEYWIAVVRESDLDNPEQCSRWSRPQPLAACIVPLTDNWAINYYHAPDFGGEAQGLAEEVGEQLFGK